LSLVPPRTRRAFVLDSLSGIFHGLYMGGVWPFLGVLARKDLGAGPLLISLIGAAPFIGFLASPFWAAHTERGAKRVAMVVVSSAASRALLIFLVFSAKAPALFFVIVVVSAIIPPFCMPAYTALIKEIYPDEWRGRLTSLVRVGITAASMAASAVVGISLVRWSFHLVLPVVAAISLIGPVFFYSRIPEPDPAPAPSPAHPLAAGLTVLRQDRLFAKFSIAFLIVGFGYMMYFPLIPILQVDELKITSEWVGWLATASALFSGISFYFWGRLVDRRGAVLCTILATVGWEVIACGYILVKSLPGLIPIALILGATSSASEVALINVVMQFSDPERIPRYSAVHYTLVGIRGLAAPLLGGLLAGIMSLRSLFAISAGLILAGLLLMLQVMKEQERDEVPAYK